VITFILYISFDIVLMVKNVKVSDQARCISYELMLTVFIVDQKSYMQRCQVSRFWRETPVFRRPLRPVVWQDLSPVFTFYPQRVQRRPQSTPLLYLFMQFSCKLVMRKTLHDCKHGEFCIYFFIFFNF